MRNKLYGVLVCGLMAITCSCEDFLDFAPEADLTEEKVFSSLENVTAYFSPVYDYVKNGHPLWQGASTQGWNINELTDASTPHPTRPSNSIRNGSFSNQQISILIDGNGNVDNSNFRPILYRNFQVVRICNNVIKNAYRIKNAPSQKEIEDIKGQAYFIRGYAYFQICRLWGGMPYLTQVLTSEDEWDRPRLSAKDTYKAIALDMDSAYVCFENAGKVRRDLEDPLNTSYDINLPNGCAAKALKSRALLYAASPLSNRGEDYDNELWKEAALAAYDAITVAKQNLYDLQPIEDWLDNTYGVKYTNEQIWAYNYGSWKFSTGQLARYLTGVMAKKTTSCYGMCPTQNFVDRYETAPRTASGSNDGYSYSLLTEEDRVKAEQAGVYDPQDPYVGLDKRFYHTIYYNGAPLKDFKSSVDTKVVPGDWDGKVNMWRKGEYLSDHVDYTYYTSIAITGYMQKRLTGDINQYITTSKPVTDPLFLLSELYLNYAEAAFEYTGSADMSVDPSVNMTSYDALMEIRNRAEQGPLRPEEKNPDIYIEKVKNERCIELAFIGHYYYDTYRWMDAPKRIEKPLMKMTVELLDDNKTFKYTREELESEHQATVWNDVMYYWPFKSDMYYQFKNFDVTQNPLWSSVIN